MITHRSRYTQQLLSITLLVLCTTAALTNASAQNSSVVLPQAQLARVVPSSFYFQGQSAPVQMRNAAAARFGRDGYVLAGLVDTSGYSDEIRAKYEGFLITDAPIQINGETLPVGAYGFGFTNDNRMNVLDLGGNEVLSVTTTNERGLRRPRPLMMRKAADGIRLYSGRTFVTIAR